MFYRWFFVFWGPKWLFQRGFGVLGSFWFGFGQKSGKKVAKHQNRRKNLSAIFYGGEVNHIVKGALRHYSSLCANSKDATSSVTETETTICS